MSCNSCAKPFTLLRKEKGCPSCGFSYCSKCLLNKVFVQKLNAEAKVCPKCKKLPQSNEMKSVEPPDAYNKRIGLFQSTSTDKPGPVPVIGPESKDKEIAARLQNLKEDRDKPKPAEQEIAERLERIKDLPKTTDEELHARLANLRGVPTSAFQNQTILITPDHRSEQEQADELMKQFFEQAKIDTQYKDQFDQLVNNMETRLGKIKNKGGENVNAKGSTVNEAKSSIEEESEDEDATVNKIIEKLKTESTLEVDDEELPTDKLEELPFCEICNEDAKMRCLGCRYLFCKRCFMDHRDEDDGCDKYESYKPPKST